MLHKRKCVVMLIVTIALLSSSCFAYADTVKVPMDLVVSPKVIDVSVTEKVNFSAGKGSANASVSDITVRNNAANSVYLLSAAYGGDVSPWTLVSNSTNFASMGKNQNKYSLTADGQDLKSGSKDYSKELAPSGSYTIKMNGKTGLSTKAVSGQRGGTVVLTVGLSVPPKIVSWANGTDEEIVAIVNALDNGEITVADTGWKVGDTRTVHLSEMQGIDANDAEMGGIPQGKFSAQDVELTIMHIGGYELANGGKCNFIVGQSSPLKELGYMNKDVENMTNTGSWDSCYRRAWLNSAYKAAMPSTIAPIFKQFKTYAAADHNGRELKVSLDYFALPAEKEMFGAQKYCPPAEINSEKIFWFDYYKNNKVDTWERSPFSDASVYLNFGQCVGGCASYEAEPAPYSLSPFGCI